MKPVAAVKTPLVASNISRRLGESVFSRAACGIISRGKGQQFEYGFDDIGNRKNTSAGGDQLGANLRPASYTNNLLNQITSRDVPGYVSVLGSAKTNATVSLWSPQSTAQYAATTRKGEYYRGELPLNNNTGAVWMTITNLAVLNDGNNPDILTNATGNAFVPKTAEVFQYDRDGNLTNDGRWTYTWDAENRLIVMTSLSSAPAGSKRKVEFAYDSKGRRIQKIVSTWNGSSYVAQSTNRFVYDGWNLIAILNPPSSILQSFTWGLDLSGSLQGAGGVGGLLAVNDAANGAQFCAYDGNGNLTALVNATNGTVTANYEYGPFGEALRLTGAMAKANPFRFSTKYQDDETDLLYYGYRSFNSSTGRWLNRDPIAEKGGNNIYAFNRNVALSSIDVLGLFVELWYGNHNVATWPYELRHSKLWLITDERELVDTGKYKFFPVVNKSVITTACSYEYAITIGAGPDHSPNELLASFNRPRDVALELGDKSLVISFSSATEGLTFLDEVSAMNKRMNDNFINTTLEYELLPSPTYTGWHGWDEFNSNSYISGLLWAFYYPVPRPNAAAPGFNKPIPSFVYRMSFESTAWLIEEWKKHYDL